MFLSVLFLIVVKGWYSREDDSSLDFPIDIIAQARSALR